MGLGFSKIFVIFLFLAIAYAYYVKSFQGFFVVIIPYIIIKIIWRILTK